MFGCFLETRKTDPRSNQHDNMTLRKPNGVISFIFAVSVVVIVFFSSFLVSKICFLNYKFKVFLASS